MSKFGDFTKGDRVEHKTVGLGTVVGISDGSGGHMEGAEYVPLEPCVCVVFDSAKAIPGSRGRGNMPMAYYDRKWFELNPDLLSKVTPEAQP